MKANKQISRTNFILLWFFEKNKFRTQTHTKREINTARYQVVIEVR